MVKKYEHKASFVESFEYVEENGEITIFNFKASLETFLIFKSITGECLTVGLDRQVKNNIEIATTKEFKILNDSMVDGVEDEKEMLRSLIEINRKVNDIHVYENGMEFSNAIIVSMYIASLPEKDKNVAMGYGLNCLPSEVYQDITLFQKLITRLLSIRDDLKKKGLLLNL